jgi:membrane dipeptidase
MKRLIAGLVCVCFLAGCGRPERGPTETVSQEDPSREEALRLARETIIIDGHIDVPYRLKHKMEDVSVRTESGQFDFVRAKEGGLDAAFMSIFTPPRMEEEGTSKALADTLVDLVESLADASPDKFAVAASPDDVEKNFESGLISLCLGMENGSPIEGDLDNLRHFFDRGVRYITLAHGKDNHICDSSYDTTHTWQGLSDFGREVVSEMNRLGIMIDVSHVTDDAFYQIADISTAPVIASHSSCRHFTPGFERNMSDDMIKRLAKNGGVIQINFGSTFVSEAAYRWWKQFDEDRDAYLDEHGFESGSDEAQAFREQYREANSFPYAGVSDVADHIDHVVELAGIDHVGLGSDFDGLGDSLPIGLKDVSMYPNLIQELLDRGYSEEDIKKIACRNVFRVWHEVERVALEWGPEIGSPD